MNPTENPRENFVGPRSKVQGQYSQLELLLRPLKSTMLFQNWKSWSRSELLNPYVLGGNCCAREIARLSGPNPQVSEIRESFVKNEAIDSCDVLVVSGVINPLMKTHILDVYEKMAKPRYVMAIGGCAATGAIFETIALDEIIPVDVYVAGCPPTLEALKNGIELLRDRMRKNISREELEAEI